jgi:uncharacterized protein YjbI with pentapeptide repeats
MLKKYGSALVGMPTRIVNLVQKHRPARVRIPTWIYWLIAGIFIAILIAWISRWGFQVLQNWTELQGDPTDGSKKKFDASLEIVKAIVGAFSAIATIAGGIILYLNFRVANDNVKIANKNVELTGSRLITERFSKAVEQLGSDKLEVRLGGIYALERIAYDSDRDHWTIMEVLTSFIQEKSSTKQLTDENISAKAYEIWQKSSKDATDDENWESATKELVTKDIHAALTVVVRRQDKDPDSKSLDLSDANLSGANFSGADLSGADLSGAELSSANLGNANLRKADLYGANLREANLSGANLSNAGLSSANLSGARLIDANLIDANLNGANLSGVYLWGANLSGAALINTNLSGAYLSDADLSGAHLWGANLIDADLSGANLNGADLSGADLSGAHLSRANLSGANLSGAHLSAVNLSWADLIDLRFIDADQLNQAKLCKTRLPQGMTLDPNRDCQELGLPENN